MQQEKTLFKQVSGAAKKLVLVLATCTSTTDVRKEALERVPCICYLVQFKKGKTPMQALIDLESEVNVIHLSFAKQLGLSIWSIDVEAQKIDGTILDTHGMVVIAFLVIDRANQVRFFEKTFLVANVSLEVVLGMPFFILSSADIDFSVQELRWRTYTTKEVSPTTRHVKLVGKQEFVAAALYPEYKTYVVYVASLSSTPLVTPLDVHPFQRPRISGLIAKETLTKVPTKYSDFADVFSLDLASELPEHSGINDHAIKLVNGY